MKEKKAKIFSSKKSVIKNLKKGQQLQRDYESFDSFQSSRNQENNVNHLHSQEIQIKKKQKKHTLFKKKSPSYPFQVFLKSKTIPHTDMKENTKTCLLTPKKEGFQSFSRFDKTPIGDCKIRTPLSEKKNNQQSDEKHAPIFKSPIVICQVQNHLTNPSKVQSNYSLQSDPESPGYPQINEHIPILQIPSLCHHNHLIELRENNDFNLKIEQKNCEQNAQNVIDALSSAMPAKFSVFNSCAQSPMPSYIDKGAISKQEQNSPFSSQNEITKLACEELLERIRKEDPFAKGNLIIKNPRFIIEIQREEEMKKFKESQLQKQVLQSLDFSNYSFSYDIPALRNVENPTIELKKQLTHPIYHKKNLNQLQLLRSPLVRNPHALIPLNKKLQNSHPYYGFPYPYFVDFGIAPLQGPQVLQVQIQKGGLNGKNSISKNNVKIEQDNKENTPLNSVPKQLLHDFSKQSHVKSSSEEELSDQNNKEEGGEVPNSKESQNKISLSTAKKRRKGESQATVTKGEENINSKRKHYGTPRSKKCDTLTPSTKKKCISKQLVKEENEEIQMTNSGKKQEDQSSNKRENIEASDDFQSSCSKEDLEEQKKECCGCKKTKCLKLYCECFQAKRYCVGSNCQGCHNKPEFDDLRLQAMESIQLRNNGAFEPKADKIQEIFENQSGQKIHSKGCNCKKSDCRKKYCECFQMGARCTDLCKCYNCKNGCSSAEQALHFQQPLPLSSLFFLEQNGISHPLPHFIQQKQSPFFYYGSQVYPQFDQWGHPIFPHGDPFYFKKIEAGKVEDGEQETSQRFNFIKMKQVGQQKIESPQAEEFSSLSKCE